MKNLGVKKNKIKIDATVASDWIMSSKIFMLDENLLLSKFMVLQPSSFENKILIDKDKIGESIRLIPRKKCILIAYNYYRSIHKFLPRPITRTPFSKPSGIMIEIWKITNNSTCVFFLINLRVKIFLLILTNHNE